MSMLGVNVRNVYCNDPVGPKDIQSNFDTMKQNFIDNKWYCIRNNSTEIIFKNESTEYDYVEIYADASGFRVTVPLKTSSYSYVTRVSSVMDLCDYLKKFLDNYQSSNDA